MMMYDSPLAENTTARSSGVEAVTVRDPHPPAMSLRELTDQVLKLQATIGLLEERLHSLHQNVAGHERVLGAIGAYEVPER